MLDPKRWAMMGHDGPWWAIGSLHGAYAHKVTGRDTWSAVNPRWNLPVCPRKAPSSWVLCSSWFFSNSDMSHFGDGIWQDWITLLHQTRTFQGEHWDHHQNCSKMVPACRTIVILIIRCVQCLAENEQDPVLPLGTSVKDRAPHPSSTKSSAKRLGEYGCTIDVNPRVRATEPAQRRDQLVARVANKLNKPTKGGGFLTHLYPFMVYDFWLVKKSLGIG